MMKKRTLVLSMLLALSATASSAGTVSAYAAGTAAQVSSSADTASDSQADDSTTEDAEGGQNKGKGTDSSGQQTPPEKPDSGQNGDSKGEPPSGEAPDGGQGQAPGSAPGQAPDGSQSQVTYSAVKEYSSADDSETLSDQTIESTGTDENAVLVDGDEAEVTLDGGTVTRKSGNSDSGNTSSFYGNSAALLATAGTLNVSGTTIDTDAQGGAGAFAYGDGTVNISDATITTKQGTSGGIHVAGGGKLNAYNLDVTTNGESSAAIRSDRGGGTMVVDGGTYTTNGTGSPAVYSTADITVHNATLTANNSEASCIEGLNTIRLFDCDLTGNMPTDNEQNDVNWNVIVYQSMSGDSEEGNGTFEMSGGTLTAKSGGMFYTTNTESTFVLNNVSITPSESNDFFLRCTGNSNGRGWGTSGANGADCTFTGIQQEMEGNIIWDQISQLDFYMTDGSTLTGAVTRDDTYSGGSGDGYCNLVIDKDSTWVVTGDSTLTSLSSEGKIVDEDGNTVSIVGTDGTTYVSGASQYTITVDTFSDQADTSGASTTDSWEDFQADETEALAQG
jgi:hypothetical protein